MCVCVCFDAFLKVTLFTSCDVMEAAGVLGRCLLLCLAFLAVSAEVNVH